MSRYVAVIAVSSRLLFLVVVGTADWDPGYRQSRERPQTGSSRPSCFHDVAFAIATLIRAVVRPRALSIARQAHVTECVGVRDDYRTWFPESAA